MPGLRLPHSTPHLCVSWQPPNESSLQDRAESLARVLGCPCISVEQRTMELALIYTCQGLEFQESAPAGGKTHSRLHVDFNSAQLRYRLRHGGGIRQPLARAIGIKPGHRPTIADATAGLGIDGFIFAALGCQVTLIERSPVLAALLSDGLSRLRHDPQSSDIRQRLSLHCGNALDLLGQLPERPETIYLDPMYPKQEKAALNKQEMRLIRTLVGDDHDAGHLLDRALTIACERVVVKRPKRAGVLTSTRPSHAIHMKNSRYDVYLIRSSNGA